MVTLSEDAPLVGRTASIILGIDPGQHGALAFLRLRDASISDLEDMPVIGNEINAHMMSRLIQGYGPIQTAIVERAQTMPKMGVSGAFNYGTGYGKILGILATLEIPIVLSSPSQWKTKWNLGRNKDLARQRASERWPEWSDSFKRAKDDGRAEACLMTAVWISENRMPRTKKPPLVKVD